MSEERIFPRAELALPVFVTLPGGTIVSCRAVDFGAQGACLELQSSLPVPEGEPFSVCFELERDWVVKARARKIWERQEGDRFLLGITYKPERSSDKHLIGPWIHKIRKGKDT